MKIEELSIGDWVVAKLPKWDYDSPEETEPMRIREINNKDLKLAHVSLAFNEWPDAPTAAVPIEALRPIPLTPEILEKNGETSKDYPAWLIAGRAVVEKEPTGEYSVHIYDAAIDKVLVTARAQHVHQLQHALRLAGIDKEIEL